MRIGPAYEPPGGPHLPDSGDILTPLEEQAAYRQRLQEARDRPNCDMCGAPKDERGYCTKGCDDDEW